MAGGWAGRSTVPAVVVAATWATFWVLRPFVDIAVDWPSFALPGVTAAGLAGLHIFYATVRPDPRVAATAEAALTMVVFSLGMALLNYFGFALHRPLVDAELAAFDRALGLDWWGCVVALKSATIPATLLTLAYSSSLGQVVVAILVLGLSGRLVRLSRYVLGFMLGAAISVAVWCVFPSFGALPLAYSRGMADAPFLLAMDPAYAKALHALHAGPVPVLRFDGLVGLIGCPSFHTVMAVLTAWALRDVAWVRFPALVVNLLVIVSVPADGGHHFVDLFAGLAVAAVAIGFAGAAVRETDEVEGDLRPRLPRGSAGSSG